MSSGGGTFSLVILNTIGSANVLTIQSISLLSSPTCIAYPGSSSTTFLLNAETTLNSGSDVNICTTTASANITTGSSATNYHSLNWSTSGTGSFTNNTTVDALTNTTYTPSVIDKTIGLVILTLNANANTGCQNQNRSITFYINPLSVGGTITGSTAVCTGTNSTTLTLSGHIGSITNWVWSAVNDFSSGVNIVTNVTTTLTTTNLTATRFYRTIVKSGVCSSSTTATFTLTVISPSIDDPSLVSGDFIWRGSSVNSTDSVDWLVPSNWYVYNGLNYNVANSLPTKTINVFIPGISTCFKANPHIFTSYSPEAADLTILSSGHLTMHTGKLSIAGNWVNNRIFTCGTGEVIFIEQGNHTIGGTVSVNVFYDFRMNKPANGSTKSVISLSKQAAIAGKMTLDLGLFDINVFNIDMGDREVKGGSNASYVRTSSTGFLKRYVGSAYNNMQSGYVIFPIGRANFNQACLNNSGISDKFSVRLFDIVSDDAQETSPMTDLPVVERTWIIEEQTIGGSDVDMQLYWNGTVSSRIEELNGFDYTSAYIAHYDVNSPTWESKGGSAPNGPGYAQQNGITSFSPFAISSRWGLGYISPLPVELLDFTAQCLEDKTVKINWSTASENNSSYFEVRKSIDSYTWNTIETIPAAGNSTELLEYSILDREVSLNNVYYLLNQVDIDGKSELFDMVNSNCIENETTNLLLTFPNPSTNEFYVNFDSEDIKGRGVLSISDSRGVIIYTKDVNIEKGNHFYTLVETNMINGVYYINLQSDQFKSNVVKHLIK